MSIKIKQHDITDCGAACIASVASHYKLVLPVSRIRQLASTDKKGTNVLGLLEALEKIGFDILNFPKHICLHCSLICGEF